MASRPRTGTEGSHGSHGGGDPALEYVASVGKGTDLDENGSKFMASSSSVGMEGEGTGKGVTEGVSQEGGEKGGRNGGGVAAEAGEVQQPFVASTAPLTFTDFLEKMRAPAAMDLVRGIKGFINDMLKSSTTGDAEGDSQKVQSFLSQSEVAFQSHPLWHDSSYEELEAAGEGLEKYLLTKLYGRCFGVAAEDKERDELLNQRMKALRSFIKPEHLDIPDKYWNEQSWTLAQKELQKINTYKAPRDKIVCILNCCKVISNLLSVSVEGAGADDFLPILIYVLIMAAPPQLESNLAFIMRYRLASRLNGEAAYFYTNMVSATTFIETISPSSLSIDASEFIAHMQAAGVPGSQDYQSQSAAPGGVTMTEVPPPAGAAAATATDSRNGVGVVTPNPKQAPAMPPASPNPLQQEREERLLSNPASGPPPVPEPVSLPPLSVVEEKGSTMLLEAEGLGELHMRYKFLYSSLSDLKLKDLGVLLNDYKELALRFESLSRGYKLVSGKDLALEEQAAPRLVKAFHRTTPLVGGEVGQPSGEGLIRLADNPVMAAGGALPDPPLMSALPTPPMQQQQQQQPVSNSPLPDLLS
ncbi:vacuolar protein sorting-associated protein [Chloropicon primus]|nr:vacuolar protein sorting-associated protein [Chloropicon primus]